MLSSEEIIQDPTIEQTLLKRLNKENLTNIDLQLIFKESSDNINFTSSQNLDSRCSKLIKQLNEKK